nr:hypothetical protein [Tanacetum cinerariifolium]
MEILPESTSNSSAVGGLRGSDDGVTTSFQLSQNSRPPCSIIKDKFMMKAQVHVSKSFTISNVQALPRKNIIDKRSRSKITSMKMDLQKEFPRTQGSKSQDVARKIHN